MDVATARALREQQKLPPGPAADVSERRIPGPGGDLAIRSYRPLDAKAALGALVYFHGGGFVLGSLDSHDAVCRQLAVDAGCAVFSVDYGLAPENKFPRAVLDAFEATRWVHGHAAELGIDAARIAVGGDSAGAALATAVAMLAKREGAPALAFQLLLYPVTARACRSTPLVPRDATAIPDPLGDGVFRDHTFRARDSR